jgi:hypothetical protein
MPADGTPLVDTGREVLLDWRAEQAVVGLKAFRMGPQQMLALDVSAWPAAPGDLSDLTPRLQESLGRLTTLLK